MSRGGGTIDALIERARAGSFEPVVILLGDERFLIERATDLLKRASLGDGPTGFNDEVFHGAATLSGQRIVSAARTLPMMAKARFVLLRDVDKMSTAEQEPLAEYLATPSESTCLVLLGEKLLPAAAQSGRISGSLLVASGLYVALM